VLVSRKSTRSTKVKNTPPSTTRQKTLRRSSGRSSITPRVASSLLYPWASSQTLSFFVSKSLMLPLTHFSILALIGSSLVCDHRFPTSTLPTPLHLRLFNGSYSPDLIQYEVNLPVHFAPGTLIPVSFLVTPLTSDISVLLPFRHPSFQRTSLHLRRPSQILHVRRPSFRRPSPLLPFWHPSFRRAPLHPGHPSQDSLPPLDPASSYFPNFEFPVLLVLLYVRVASLFHVERVGPDQF
jgi:hypothetical protein